MNLKKKITTLEKERENTVEMFEGFYRTTLTYNDDIMLCHFSMKKGAKIPLHHHVAVQNGYVIKGKIELLSEEGESIIAQEGTSYVFDSEEVHGALALEDSEYVETFYPIRPEYYPK
jgi:quercetin dioxygenase-like cupin family protein